MTDLYLQPVAPHLVLLLLVFGHFLADYPLQGDFLSAAKHHKRPIPGVPWYQAMFAHSSIHAGFAGLITGSIVIAAAELVAHFVIDWAKCSDRLTFNADQALHLLCKVLWVLALYPIVWEIKP